MPSGRRPFCGDILRIGALKLGFGDISFQVLGSFVHFLLCPSHYTFGVFETLFLCMFMIFKIYIRLCLIMYDRKLYILGSCESYYLFIFNKSHNVHYY